MIDLHSTVRS